MPYRIEGNCVQVQHASGWQDLKCYDTRADALAYLRALEANVNEDHKVMTPLSQSEAGYIPVSVTRGKMCANCRFFCMGEEGDHCMIVESYPEAIMQTGYCLRWEAPPPMPEVEPIPVTIIEPPMEEEDSGQMMAVQDKPTVSLIQKLKGYIWPSPDFAKPFTVFKAADGLPRWIATFSNNFEDRDGEIISEKAWDGWLKRLDMGFAPMPELWIGHIPGTKHGQADMVFAVGNFVCATGTFDDTPEAKRAVQYYTTKGRDTPLSHGFTFPKWAFKDGVYEVINTFEISTLPPPLVAANPFTELEVKDMKQITAEQLAALEKVVGKDSAAKIVTDLQTQSAKLQELGVNAKDFTDVDAPPVPPAGESSKAMGDLLSDILDGQSHLLNLFENTATAAKAAREQNTTLEARIKSISAQVEALEAKLGDAPRRASEAAETKLSDAEKEALKKQLPVEYDPMFPGMQVPLEIK